MSTFSLDSSVRLMISNRVLTASVDSCLEQPLTVATEWIRLDFVYVFDMERTSLFFRCLRVNEPELIVKKLGVLIKNGHIDGIDAMLARPWLKTSAKFGNGAVIFSRALNGSGQVAVARRIANSSRYSVNFDVKNFGYAFCH